MANTMTLIASSTVGSGGAASIDFTSIPSTYTDLVLDFSVRSATSSTVDNINIGLNGSTSSFSGKGLTGDGAAASSTTLPANRFYGLANGATGTSNTFSNCYFYFPNYTSSNYKSFSMDNVQENNTTTAYVRLTAGLWAITSAITSITMTTDSGSNFVQFSTAYLYGIKNS